MLRGNKFVFYSLNNVINNIHACTERKCNISFRMNRNFKKWTTKKYKKAFQTWWVYLRTSLCCVPFLRNILLICSGSDKNSASFEGKGPNGNSFVIKHVTVKSTQASVKSTQFISVLCVKSQTCALFQLIFMTKFAV